MQRFGSVFAAVVAAAASVPAALADSSQWTVSGSGVGTGTVAGDRLELGAQSDIGGANVAGSAQNQFTLVTTRFNDGGDMLCLTVSGNRAVVLFRFRVPVSVPELPGEVFEYGGAYIEDNGNPVDGQPVDRMADFAVREQNVHFFCDSPSFDFFASVAEPLSSGNYVVQG